MGRNEKSYTRGFMLKKVAKYFGALIILYVVIYVVLSLFGKYQPSTVGANNETGYGWSPLGFYDPKHPAKGTWAAEHSQDKKTGGWSSVMVYRSEEHTS